MAARAFALGRRRRRSTPEPLGREVVDGLRSALPTEAVADARVVEVPGGRPPWTPTGMELSAGDVVSTFAVGRIHHSRLFDLWAGPATQLWFLCAGRAFRGTRATHTFTAEAGGPLEVASYLPGMWADERGTLAGEPGDYHGVRGALAVLIVRWAPGADSEEALRAMADGNPLARAELDRRATWVPEPQGWRHLWEVGATEIYADGDDGIQCTTQADVGLIRHPVDFPLTEAARLRWSWRVDELPSELPEDTLPTHDYLSVALEFENGHDLTWHWSAELPSGYHYRCPLPHWCDRETHVVVRSGGADLGRWIDEEVAVRADYRTAVGEPPERITGVWLIALSLFQRRRGRCAYRGIELSDGERSERVL